jgi:hypothetical protein
MSSRELADVVMQFIAECRAPALLESGEEPLTLTEGHFSLDVTGGRVLMEAWSDDRNLSRRITGVSAMRPGQLELEIQRLGKRAGTLTLLDRERPTAASIERRARRHVLRERLGRFVRRQFGGWRLVELSAEADLEHTLSPAYARAFLKKGTSAWAAIAAPDEPGVADSVLTYGLIWLDYVRRREQNCVVEGLCLLVPHGRELATCLRLRWLHPRLAHFSVDIYDEDDWEEPVDWRIHGNLDTRLEPANITPAPRLNPATAEARLEARARADIRMLDPKLKQSPVYGQVPAWAAADRGVMDLLAVEESGRLTVVELKATADPNLPMQALDYWLRVHAHHQAGDFTAQGYFPGVALSPEPPRLLLAAPALHFHETTETLLRCFSPSIDVERVGLSANEADSRTLFRVKGSQTPW